MDAPRFLRLRTILPLTLAAYFTCITLGFSQEPRPQTGTAKSKQGVRPSQKKSRETKDQTRTSQSIDLNSASAEELMTVPGVGEAYARKIIEGRPYKTVDDLSRAGLPAATVSKVKTMVVVRPMPTPVDVNNDSALRLQTLPGVGPALAKEIIAGRPYSSINDLAKVRGLGASRLDDLRGRGKFGTANRSTPAKEKAKAKAKAESTTPRSTRETAEEPGTRGSEPRRKTTKADQGRRPPAGTRTTPAEAADSPTVTRGGETKEKMTKSAEARRKTGEAKTATKSSRLAPGTKININTASRQELDNLLGIGPVKSQAIIDARPFSSIEDIKKVKGIKEGEYAKLRDFIVVK